MDNKESDEKYFELLRTLITAARNGHKELYTKTRKTIRFCIMNFADAKEFFKILGKIKL